MVSLLKNDRCAVVDALDGGDNLLFLSAVICVEVNMDFSLRESWFQELLHFFLSDISSEVV